MTKLLGGRSRSGSTASIDSSYTASGRVTPEQQRRSGKAAAQSLLANDGRYKKFAAQVDRVLQSFENVNEWADFISFLSRLLKTLQAPSPSYPEIPRKLIVAKRLAQCLNPALPSGVHQRALDVYSYILTTIGTDGLRRELVIWSSGLFPFFQYATTSVRPMLLNLYETHYLPLDEGLRPALKAFMLALLPGLEEETGDFFDRVLTLLARVSSAVGEDFYLQNTFLILLSSPASRLAALNYLARQAVPIEVSHMQAGLMVRGTAAALGDGNMLVRRNALDLLLRAIPLDGVVLRTAESDKELLVRAVSSVLLQRDASLSRRVYAWFLRGETSSEQIAYFQHGLDTLVSVLQSDMKTEPSAFRVFLAMLDKAEIASVLAPRLVMPALEVLKGTGEEAMATAIYEAVDPALIWDRLSDQVNQGIVDTALWVAKLPQHDEETTAQHIPRLLDKVIQSKVSIELAEALFRITATSCWSQGGQSGMGEVYARIVQNTLGLTRDPRHVLSSINMGRALLDVEVFPPMDCQQWKLDLLNVLQNGQAASFEIVEAVVTALIGLATSREGIKLDRNEMSTILQALVQYTKRDAAAYHVRAVELLWEANQLAEVHAWENVIAAQLSKPSGWESFGTVWRLTDERMLPGELFFAPILTIVDALKGSQQRRAESWLRANLQSYFRVIDPIIVRIEKGSDLSIQRHLFETLQAILDFGGAVLGKACQETDVSRSSHPSLLSRSGKYTAMLVQITTSYIDLPAPTDIRQRQLLLETQTAALDVLELLIPYTDHRPVQHTLIQKTTDCIERGELSLQGKLLQLLHATMGDAKRRRTSVSDDAEIVNLVELGVTTTKCQPVLQQWADFVILSTPHFGRHDLLERLSSCFDDRIRQMMFELKHAYEAKAARLVITESEPIMLLDVQEKIVLQLLNKTDQVEDKEGNSILGLVSAAFSGEGPSHQATSNKQWLDDVVHAFLVVWTITAHTATPTQEHVYSRIRLRTRKVLEKLFKAQPGAMLGSFVRIWALASDEISDAAIFDAIDGLTPSAQRVVEMVGEVLVKNGRLTLHSVDAIYTGFLEMYLHRLEAPIAVQIWSTVFGLARDVLSAAGTPQERVSLYPMLRCVTTLAQAVATTSALEDKRLRRDLQETYAKLIDVVVTSLPRVSELDIWERSSTGTTQERINRFITSILPRLRLLLLENDRVASTCSAISLSIIVPSFKHDRANATILDMLVQMSKINAAHRSWRSLVADAFAEPKFFTHAHVPEWRVLVNTLMDSDKERFPDLLSRITAAPSTNIFTNKEQEMISRALNLKRLAYVLLAAEQNHYLVHLPSIQEKLVDILRTDIVSSRVQSEVYLCLRVLMCRIGAQHLTNFWPVILAELLKVFEGAMDDPPADDADALHLLLAACKFLDLLLVLQSEDFQIHQWMFVTDTTDAIFPPADHDAESIMDRLSDIMAEYATPSLRSTPRLGGPDDTTIELAEGRSPTGQRRPRLNGVRKLHTLLQLRPFFSRASMETYEGVYLDAGVDWTAVEDGLWGEVEA